MSVSLCLVFIFLVGVLFDMQIVSGHIPVVVPNAFTRQISTTAPRGEIFDAFGRPLAINIPVFAVMLDPSITQPDPGYSFSFFINLMGHYGEDIRVDSEFLISSTTPRQFLSTAAARRRWLMDLEVEEGLIDELNPESAYALLKEMFEIPSSMNEEDAHNLLLMRTAFSLQRFNLHHIPLASDISRQAVAALGEHAARMPGIYVAFDYLRYYPMGKYTTNIVGYITQIRPDDLEEYQDMGLNPTDLFGLTGAERAFEHYLRGQRGVANIEVDGNFRRTAVLDEVPPTPGHDIHLTIDSVLQRNIYYILEDNLSTILINRLRSNPTSFSRELVEHFVASGHINSTAIMQVTGSQQELYPASYLVANFVRDNADFGANPTAYVLRPFLRENILSGRINIVHMLQIMAEQGILSQAPEPGQAPVNFLIEMVEAREITPAMVTVPFHPVTGTVMVMDVNSGAVLAAVNYPTFNANNLLTHSFCADYFAHINSSPNSPQLNRVFESVGPPGSTFKMITALAALEEGVISPNTRIFDHTVFRDAGQPYMRCWIHGSGTHGSINVADAIAVSCNYFFARIAWNLGNPRDGRMLEGIAALNYYMKAVGLGAPTGIEIAERQMVTSGVNSVPRIASPAYREARGDGAWTAGEMSNTSIGQGQNDYTTASMANYMATLATGGIRYNMHLLSHKSDAEGNITRNQPTIAGNLNIAPENVEVIHRGMRDVAFGARGTGRGIFAGFPMEVALKSGTAETGFGVSHSTYGGFAPLDNPQIAVYVMMPFGDTPYLRASAGHVTRAVLEEYFGFNQAANGNGNGLAR